MDPEERRARARGTTPARRWFPTGAAWAARRSGRRAPSCWRSARAPGARGPRLGPCGAAGRGPGPATCPAPRPGRSRSARPGCPPRPPRASARPAHAVTASSTSTSGNVVGPHLGLAEEVGHHHPHARPRPPRGAISGSRRPVGSLRIAAPAAMAARATSGLKVSTATGTPDARPPGPRSPAPPGRSPPRPGWARRTAATRRPPPPRRRPARPGARPWRTARSVPAWAPSSLKESGLALTIPTSRPREQSRTPPAWCQRRRSPHRARQPQVGSPGPAGAHARGARPRGPHAGGDALGRRARRWPRPRPAPWRRRGTTAGSLGPEPEIVAPRQSPPSARARMASRPGTAAARCGSCRRSASSGGRSSRRSSHQGQREADRVRQRDRRVGQGDRRRAGRGGRRRWRCGTRG